MNNQRVVNVGVKLFRIIGIDTNQQSIDADIQVESWWKIPNKERMEGRILNKINDKNYKKLDKNVLSHQVWNPKIRLTNLIKKIDEELHYKVVCIDTEYYIKETRHIIGKFEQDFLLHSFPFDYQNLTFHIESKRDDKKVSLMVAEHNISNFNKNSRVEEWYVPKRLTNKVDYLGTFPSVEISMKIYRSSRYFMINIIAINFLIHLVTLSNVTIDHNQPEDRLNISVMLLLIGVAFKMNNNDSLPNISYLTHMDKYHIASLVYHSLSVLQNVVSSLTSNSGNFDQWSIIFLGSFIFIMNSVFIIKGLVSRHYRRKDIGC